MEEAHKSITSEPVRASERALSASIRKLAIERIRFFQDRLWKNYGIIIKCEAEIEYFAPNAGNSTTLPLAKESRGQPLRLLQEPEGWLERQSKSQETKSIDYPIIGSNGKPLHRNSCLNTAKAIEAYRNDKTRSASNPAEFRSNVPEYDPRSAFGLHLNVSVWNKNGIPLFVDPVDHSYSHLLYECAKNMLHVQHEGMALFVPVDDAFRRFRVAQEAPRYILCSREKENNNQKKEGASLSVRDESAHTGKIVAEKIRLENRLPAAESDPYLSVLATLGALSKAIEENREKTASETELSRQKTEMKKLHWFDLRQYMPHPGDRRLASETVRFQGSDLMKEVLGENLHTAITKYAEQYHQMPHWDPQNIDRTTTQTISL